MRKGHREIIFFVLLPLIITSISLAVIGQPLKNLTIPRIVTTRQETKVAQVNCSYDSCSDLKNLDSVSLSIKKDYLKNQLWI